MKKLSIPIIIKSLLITVTIALFFACSNNGSSVDKPPSLQEFKQKEGDSKTSDATQVYWAIPEPYTNVPIEQIKAQIEITDYMVMKGAATDAGTEDTGRVEKDRSIVREGGGAVEKDPPKNKADRAALASYINKTISLEGVVDLKGIQKTTPLVITEPEPGKYQIWFCDKTRKPCKYQAFLLYI